MAVDDQYLSFTCVAGPALSCPQHNCDQRDNGDYRDGRHDDELIPTGEL
jgi:hypothetical protein